MKTLRHIFHLDRMVPWLILALVVRGGFFVIFLHEHGLRGSYWGMAADTGDSGSYFASIDHYLEGVGYHPDIRMPGYGLPYLVARWFTTPPGAAACVLYLQLFLSSLSVVLLMRCARLLGASPKASLAVFWCFALYGPLAVWDVYVMTESLFASLSIIGIYLLLKHRQQPSLPRVLLAGTLFAWAFFMRPMYLVWFPVLMVMAAAPALWERPKRWLAAILITLPFLFAEVPWTLRNWRAHHEFRPLTNGLVYQEMLDGINWPVNRLLYAVGGRATFWDPNAEIRWFRVPDWNHFARLNLVYDSTAIGEWATSEHYTMDSLRAMRNDLEHWKAAPDTSLLREHIRHALNDRVDRHIADYKDTRPFQFHVMSRLRHLRHFFWHTGVLAVFRDWEHALASWQVALQWFFTSLYILIAATGSFAIARTLLLWNNTNGLMRAIALIGSLAVLVFPFIFRMDEARYLLPAIPWLLVIGVVVIDGMHRNAPSPEMEIKA